MMNVFNRLLLQPISTRLPQVILVGGLSLVGVLSGITPQMNSQAQLGIEVALAQSADGSISNYARAALAIEQLRQTKYNEAKDKLGGNVPSNVCGQQDPPAAVRTICDEFMRETTNIIRQNGMSVSQFNEITRRKNNDPSLQQQIQTELLRIQKSP